MPESAPPIRIAWIFPTLDYGGAERQFLELARAIDKRLFEPHFILLNDHHRLLDDQYGRIEGVAVHVVPRRRSCDPRRLSDLNRLLKQVRPDMIHTVLPAANLWGLWAARRLGIRPCIGSQRNRYENRMNRWYWIDRLCLNTLADTVVVNSDTIRDNCSRFVGVRSEKIHRIYNGISTPSTPETDREAVLVSLGVSDPHRCVVTTLCRLDRNKSVGDILKAVRLLRDRNRPVTLVIGGTGPCQTELQLQSRRLELADQVVFADPIRDVPALLRCSNMVVLASRSEGFPNVLLEAMGWGVLVAASDISAHREMIRPEQTGILFPWGDPKAMADGIQTGLDQPDLRLRIGRQAREDIRSRFSLEEMVRSYQQLYLDLRKSRQ